jgi:hypothetical protein
VPTSVCPGAREARAPVGWPSTRARWSTRSSRSRPDLGHRAVPRGRGGPICPRWWPTSRRWAPTAAPLGQGARRGQRCSTLARRRPTDDAGQEGDPPTSRRRVGSTVHHRQDQKLTDPELGWLESSFGNSTYTTTAMRDGPLLCQRFNELDGTSWPRHRQVSRGAALDALQGSTRRNQDAADKGQRHHRRRARISRVADPSSFVLEYNYPGWMTTRCSGRHRYQQRRRRDGQQNHKVSAGVQLGRTGACKGTCSSTRSAWPATRRTTSATARSDREVLMRRGTVGTDWCNGGHPRPWARRPVVAGRQI